MASSSSENQFQFVNTLPHVIHKSISPPGASHSLVNVRPVPPDNLLSANHHARSVLFVPSVLFVSSDIIRRKPDLPRSSQRRRLDWRAFWGFIPQLAPTFQCRWSAFRTPHSIIRHKAAHRDHRQSRGERTRQRVHQSAPSRTGSFLRL
jgi:hypothetical protein